MHILTGVLKSILKNRTYSSAYRKALIDALKLTNGANKDLEGVQFVVHILSCIVLQGVYLSCRLSYAALWAVFSGPMAGSSDRGGEGCWASSDGPPRRDVITPQMNCACPDNKKTDHITCAHAFVFKLYTRTVEQTVRHTLRQIRRLCKTNLKQMQSISQRSYI